MMNHEKFITSIHVRPALWDTRTYEYRNKRLKDLLWIEVGDSVNITDDDARKRFTSLREKYRREQKKIEMWERTGIEYDSEKVWEFFENLKFLDECFKPRKLPSISDENLTMYTPKMSNDFSAYDNDYDDDSDEKEMKNFQLNAHLSPFQYRCYSGLEVSITTPTKNDVDLIRVKTEPQPYDSDGGESNQLSSPPPPSPIKPITILSHAPVNHSTPSLTDNQIPSTTQRPSTSLDLLRYRDQQQKQLQQQNQQQSHATSSSTKMILNTRKRKLLLNPTNSTMTAKKSNPPPMYTSSSDPESNDDNNGASGPMNWQTHPMIHRRRRRSVSKPANSGQLTNIMKNVSTLIQSQPATSSSTISTSDRFGHLANFINSHLVEMAEEDADRASMLLINTLMEYKKTIRGKSK